MPPLLRLLAAAVAVLVVLPSAAQAKELMSVQVCGRDECLRIRDRDLLAPGLIHGSLVARPPAREPFARLVMHIGDGRQVVARERSAFLPRAGLYRLRTGQWFRPGEAAVAALRRIAATLALVPAERLPIARPREPLAPASAAPHTAAAVGGLPGWLAPAAAALLVALALVPLARIRRAPAG